MTSRRRGVALTPMETRREVIVRTAVLADELGYEIIAVPEGWGLDPPREAIDCTRIRSSACIRLRRTTGLARSLSAMTASTGPASSYAVLGAGKTAADACSRLAV